MKQTLAVLLVSLLTLTLNGQVAQFDEEAIPTGYALEKGTLDFTTAKYNTRDVSEKGIAISYEIISRSNVRILRIGYYQNYIVLYRDYIITEDSYSPDDIRIHARSYMDDYVRLVINDDGFVLDFNYDEENFDTGVWGNYYLCMFASRQ